MSRIYECVCDTQDWEKCPCRLNDALVLDEYERSNLVALMHMVYTGALGPLNTGDWCGQIYWKLTNGKGFDPEIHNPNLPIDMQLDDVRAYWQRKLGGK